MLNVLGIDEWMVLEELLDIGSRCRASLWQKYPVLVDERLKNACTASLVVPCWTYIVFNADTIAGSANSHCFEHARIAQLPQNDVVVE